MDEPAQSISSASVEEVEGKVTEVMTMWGIW